LVPHQPESSRLSCYSQRLILHTLSRVQPTRPVGRCRQAIVDPRRLRSSQVMSARMLLRPHQSPSELPLRQQLLKITIVSVYPSRHASPYTLPASLLSGRDSFHFGVPVSIIFVCIPPLHVGPSILTLAMLITLLLAACQLHHVLPNRCSHAALLTQPLPLAVEMHIHGCVAGRLLLLPH
jgi:hypothetical protein